MTGKTGKAKPRLRQIERDEECANLESYELRCPKGFHIVNLGWQRDKHGYRHAMEFSLEADQDA